MADNNLLANNLAQLGGQIASTFQNVALQNQYKNSLPAMQQVFQQSMADFDSGKTGAGFARIMDVAMQNPNNPYIQNMAQMAFKAGQLASDDYFKRQQIDIARSKAGGTSRGLTQEDIDSFMNFGQSQGTGQVAIQGQGAAQGQGTGQGTPAQVTDEKIVDKKIVDTPWFRDIGIPIDAVEGPAKFQVKVEKGTTETRSVNRLGPTRSKSQTTGVEYRNEELEKDFDEKIKIARDAASLIKSNRQLNGIFNSANKDFNNIQLDEAGNAKDGFTYTATVLDAKGNPIGKPEDLSEKEFNALNSLKQIPDYINNSGGKVKLISKQEDRPTQTQGGLPAVQVQSTIPEIPEEARGLQQIVEQGQTAKAQEAAKNVEARINDIDSQIKRLSSSTAAPQTRLQSEGTMPLRSKTPQQAKADIEKIAQLKKQKRVLQGKYETPQEVGEAVQSGLLTRDQSLSILRNQFKM